MRFSFLSSSNAPYIILVLLACGPIHSAGFEQRAGTPSDPISDSTSSTTSKSRISSSTTSSRSSSSSSSSGSRTSTKSSSSAAGSSTITSDTSIVVKILTPVVQSPPSSSALRKVNPLQIAETPAKAPGPEIEPQKTTSTKVAVNPKVAPQPDAPEKSRTTSSPTIDQGAKNPNTAPRPVDSVTRGKVSTTSTSKYSPSSITSKPSTASFNKPTKSTNPWDFWSTWTWTPGIFVPPTTPPTWTNTRTAPDSVSTPLNTTYTNAQVTMETPPVWGDQPIPPNTCSFTANQGNLEWTPCEVFAGTVQVSFFPEATNNITYPKTFYDQQHNFVMTSPSVYMIINVVSATNNCGRLGPIITNYVLPLDLEEIKTYRPFAHPGDRDRMGDPRQLTLADLMTNCPEFHEVPADATLIQSGPAIIDEHPLNNDWNRCFPRVSMPARMKSIGNPYWRHCGDGLLKHGIFDPPGAVPPVHGLFSTTAHQPVISTPPVAVPSPTAIPIVEPTSTPKDLGFIFTPLPQLPSPTPILTPSNAPPQPDQSPAPVPVPNPPPPPTQSDNKEPVVPDILPPTPVESAPTPVQPNAPNQPVPTQNPVVPPPSDGSPINNAPLPTNRPPANAPPPSMTSPPSAMVVIGTNTISAGSAGIVLPGNLPAPVGSVTTLKDVNNNEYAVSVAASGIYVGTGSTATFIPHVAEAPPSPIIPVGAVPIATIKGEVVNMVPGATTLVIQHKTLTAGALPVTLVDEGVAVLGNSGLIIQYPKGVVSYYPLPSAAPAPVGMIGSINDNQVTTVAGGSAVVVGSQTISIGGPVATLADNAVITLASVANGLGIVIQLPKGVVSTMYITVLPTPAPKGEGLGGIIASVVGIAHVAATTTSATIASVTITSASTASSSIASWSAKSVTTRTASSQSTNSSSPVLQGGYETYKVLSSAFSAGTQAPENKIANVGGRLGLPWFGLVLSGICVGFISIL